MDHPAYNPGLQQYLESNSVYFVYLDSGVYHENPMFISACYLELTLLKKIRETYKRTYSEDIVKFYSRASQGGKLAEAVGGSVCDRYIRKLFDRYTITVRGSDGAYNEPLGIPQMRAWTNAKTQRAINISLVNELRSVHKASSDEGRENRATRFMNAYRKHKRRFYNSHCRFLEEMLKASELMTWMCLGVTTDDPHHGLAHAAFWLNHLEVQMAEAPEEAHHPAVCWNYILASGFRRGEKRVKKVPVPSDYFSGYMELERELAEKRKSE